MIRDQLDPDMNLGHSDINEMDEDEAAQARKLFGVEWKDDLHALIIHTPHRIASNPGVLRCVLIIKL